MSKKVKFLLSFPEIKEKGELYNLYKGFINCLNNIEAFALLINKRTTGLRAEPIINKIIYGAVSDEKKQTLELFEKAITKIERLKWPQKQRVTKVLHGINSSISNKETTKLIKYFLNSKYNSFRYYGCDIIEKSNLEDKFKKELIKAWNEYPDTYILDLLVDFLTPKELYLIYKDAEKILTESEFDFEVLKLRNKYYSRIVKYIPKRLSYLQSKDSVSYVFVMKNAGRKIDKDFALNTYKKNKNYRSLLACYGNLGMWELLMEIFNDVTEKPKRK